MDGDRLRMIAYELKTIGHKFKGVLERHGHKKLSRPSARERERERE